MRLLNIFLATLIIIGAASAAFYPMQNYPQTVQTDVKNSADTLAKVLVETWNNPAAGNDALLKGFTATSATEWTNITSFSAQPDFARGIVITGGGTATDIKGCTIIVKGKNINNENITESFTVVVDTAGAIQGSKAFKQVYEVDIPPQDGAGAQFKVGTNEKLGLKNKLSVNGVLNAYLNYVKESTAPTVAVSSTALESNTIDLNSALNGNKVIVMYVDY